MATHKSTLSVTSTTDSKGISRAHVAVYNGTSRIAPGVFTATFTELEAVDLITALIKEFKLERSDFELMYFPPGSDRIDVLQRRLDHLRRKKKQSN